MRRADSPSSWMVIEDIPELLQFAAFVGEREGFAPPPDGIPRSAAEAGWRQWWDEVPRQIRAGIPIDWPAFDSLADRPALRALCQAHWDAFLQEWQREKPVDIQRQLAQVRAMPVQEMVAARERELGRPARDFTLRLDFTRWPDEYHREVSGSHLVLGRAFLEPSHLSALRRLVAARLEALA